MKDGSNDVGSDTSARPAAGKVRIQALDVIRGLAILGILAVNADGFAVPQAASLSPVTWPYLNEGPTAISYWIMDTFFHEKFLTIFSMLFGVSLYLVGGERSDQQKGRVLARRLAILLLFGLLHGFGLWWGDILSLYAVTGFLMFLCRSWKPNILLAVGLALYAGMAVYSIPPAASPFAPAEMTADAKARLVPDPVRVTAWKADIAGDIAEAKASWSGAYAVNAGAYRNLLSGNPWLIPQTLALMMIGLSLFKTGFLAGRSSDRRYAVMTAIGALALGVAGWMSWQVVMLEKPVVGERGYAMLLSPFVSLAYVAVLILLLRAGAASALAPLAAAGRMAFTNYLSQSLLMTTLFYGGRGALMGELDRPALWALTVAIWALQLIWSPLWLSRFEMGPLEWVWRCLTLGRRVPLRKIRSGT